MAGHATITPWLKAAFRLPDLLYRNGLGWVLGRRFLRLLHVGRRTGTRYAAVLEVVRHDPSHAEFVVVSGFGTRTDWLRNIEAGNPVEVTVGRRTFVADHRRLDREEAFAAMADYERRNRMIGPVVRRALSWLLGWRYDGSVSSRWRLVDQLPMVALRPAQPWE
jgi:deazaflavin-dependent oxidoreductase (nitroreductase family)